MDVECRMRMREYDGWRKEVSVEVGRRGYLYLDSGLWQLVDSGHTVIGLLVVKRDVNDRT